MNIETTSIDKIRKTVEYLCDLGVKVAGTDTEIQAANYLYGCLKDYGFSHVEKQSFDVHGWNPKSCRVRITKPIEKELESALFPHGKSESIEGLLSPVDWEIDENESSASLFGKGRVAFSEWGPDTYLSPRYTYLRAVKLGYEGIIVSAKDEGNMLKVVVIPGGLLKIPVVCITKEEGDSLLSLMNDGDVVVKIKTEVEISERLDSFNVVAILEGDRTTTEEIVIGAHYDSWFQGAADNCAPVAIVLELARIFQNHAKSGNVPRRTIRFLFYGAEESGTDNFYFWLNGSRAYVRNNKESVARTIAVLSLDSTGYASPSIDWIYTTGEMHGFAKSLTVEHGRARSLTYKVPPSYGSDHWFFELSGVPTIYGVSGIVSEHGIAQPSPLYHTTKDDPNHLDYDALHFYAEFMKNALSYLSSTDLLPMDIFVPLEKFYEILTKYSKMDGNPFDLLSIIAKVKDFMKHKSSFTKLLSSIDQKGKPKDVTRINKFLMKVANGCNRTIGWNTRPIETYSVDYLYRFEMIEDYIHLTNSIKSLRNIPVATFDLDSAKRIESKSDNPYNWLSVHDSLAKLESERTRIGKEIEQEIASLSEFLNNIMSELKELMDK
ncbi:MAG: M28 family metallopeptidase [Candidatus Thorarchaeota archaeon SMTZ1-45]